jgi:hypothetical protein
METPGYEPNDLGRLSSADGRTVGGRLEYRETVPGRWLRAYSFSASTEQEWNYSGDHQVGFLQPQVQLTWRNFWKTNVTGTINPRLFDERLTRGGPQMQKPGNWLVQLVVSNSDASQTRGSVDVRLGGDEDEGRTFRGEMTIAVQPRPQWLLSLNPMYEHLIDTQQYVSTIGGGSAMTYGRRYVFAHIDRQTYSAKVRMSYTFKPDLNVDLYAEPFAASGRYDNFGELAAPRGRALREYGSGGTMIQTASDGAHTVTDGGQTFTIRNVDFNVLSFRSNLVLRWEWRPGSTLYVVWQQDRSSREAVGLRATAGDLFDSFSAPGRNFLAVKASFWFSMN